MTPKQREIIESVASEYFTSSDMIVGPRRYKNLIQARIQCSIRMRAQNYSLTQIGNAISKDHSTICYYLDYPSLHPVVPGAKPAWRAPRIKHLHCQGCRHCKMVGPNFPNDLVRPAVKQKRQLIRYAGYEVKKRQARR